MVQIDVDEELTTAASVPKIDASGSFVEDDCNTRRFCADHPFVSVVWDGNGIFFFVHVCDPAAR